MAITPRTSPQNARLMHVLMCFPVFWNGLECCIKFSHVARYISHDLDHEVMSHSQVASHLRRLHALGRSGGVGFRTLFVFTSESMVRECVSLCMHIYILLKYLYIIVHTYETRFACSGCFVNNCF